MRKTVFDTNRAVQSQKISRWRLKISDLGRRGFVLSMQQKQSLAVTVFVFAYAKAGFLNDAAHFINLVSCVLNAFIQAHMFC